MSEPESKHDYRIAWITALAIERAAAIALLDEMHEEPEDFDQSNIDKNSYAWGRLSNHNVVIASLPVGGYGLTNAAKAVLGLLSSLEHIKIGLLVGIGAGLPEESGADIRLGDVAVSQPEGTLGGVVQYDMVKARGDGFERTGLLVPPPEILMNALTSLKAYHELQNSRIPQFLQKAAEANLKFAQNYKYPGKEHDSLYMAGTTASQQAQMHHVRSDSNPYIHYGTIASGNILVKDAETRQKIIATVGQPCICLEMEAAGLMNSFPCLVIRGICDYADSNKNDIWQRYASATAAAFTKELLLYVRPSALVKAGGIRRMLEQMEIDMKEQKERIVKIQDDVKIARDDSIYERLPFVAGAPFDCYGDLDELGGKCLPQTRIKVLQEIRNWVECPQSKPIFWLNGMAGTGKSTILRTIATEYHEKSQLGASFFFKRGAGDQGTPDRLFSTLARQLARNIPPICHLIHEAVLKDSDIGLKPFGLQFKHLFLRPITALSGYSRPLLIIVDALDECGKDARKIINQFAELKPSHVHVRVLVSSRPDEAAQDGFRDISSAAYASIVLHTASRLVVTDDILKYLEAGFAQIRKSQSQGGLAPDWPGEDTLLKLADMASPLFIYAATVCRFVGERRFELQSRLNAVLQNTATEGFDNLHGMYQLVLNEWIKTATTTEKLLILADFKTVVGSIVVFAESLSTKTMAGLLNMEEEYINQRLEGLQPVLLLPSQRDAPVKTLHLSFNNFLLNSEMQHHDYLINFHEAHQNLASRCLKHICYSEHLKQDICNLGKPGYLRSDIDQAIIARCLPQSVQYACHYWIAHIIAGQHWTTDYDHQVSLFFQKYFLYWFEALCLLGRVSEVVALLSGLLEKIPEQHSAELRSTIHDARQFVLMFKEIANVAPLQLYSSCLAFAPQNSIIRKNYQHCLPPWLIRLPSVSFYSVPNLFCLSRGHIHVPGSLAFSPDHKVLASAEYYGNICFWDVATGVLLKVLKDVKRHIDLPMIAFDTEGRFLACDGYEEEIYIWNYSSAQLHDERIEKKPKGSRFSSFSSDGKLFLFHSKEYDRSQANVWSLEKKQLQRILEVRPSSDARLALSPDNSLLAHTPAEQSSGFYLDLWIVETNQLYQAIEQDSSEIKAMLFSPHSSHFVYALGTRIKLWNITSKQIDKNLGGHIDRVDSLAFSPNAGLLASGSPTAIKLWNTSTGQLLQTLERDSSSRHKSALAFSPNGKTLATAMAPSINLWDVSTAEVWQNVPERDSDLVTSTELSPNGKIVASASRDKKVRLWGMACGRLLREFNGHESIPEHLAFSHNGEFLASCSENEEIKLWTTKTGELYRQFNGSASISLGYRHSGAFVTFSPDDKLLLSAGAIFGSLWNIHAARLERELRSSEDFKGHVPWVRCEPVMYMVSDDYMVTPTRPKVSEQRFTIQKGIICVNNRKLLWLPDAYQRHFEQHGDCICIGSDFGQILFLEIAPDHSLLHLL